MSNTFKQRVDAFWQWYSEVGQRFFETIEANKCRELTDEVADFMGETMPALAWVFGPGEAGGHSFTISGEGQVAKQFLAQYWLSQATEMDGWTFYDSRQASNEFDDFVIEIGDLGRVDATNFLIKTTVDEESEKLDIVAWHTLFEQLPEEHHGQLLFLFLDEALGEFGVQTWIGGIDIEPIDAESVDGRMVHRLADFPKFIRDVQRYHGWEKLSPLETYTGYSLPEQSDQPRGDTIAGITCIPRLIFELIENGGQLEEDPLDGTGASLEYLSISGDALDDNDRATARQNIEDVLRETLEDDGLGRTLGGATGLGASYADLLLFDGERSRKAVDEAMDRLALTGRYRWHSFAQ